MVDIGEDERWIIRLILALELHSHAKMLPFQRWTKRMSILHDVHMTPFWFWLSKSDKYLPLLTGP